MKSLYAIFDIRTMNFGVPVLEHNDATAERTIKTEMQNKDSMLSRHPEDYELWKIGTYNEESGELTPDKQRILRCTEITKKEGA